MKEHKIFLFPDGSKVSYRDIEQLLQENEKLKSEIIDTNSVIEDISINLGLKQIDSIYECFYAVKDLLKENKKLKEENTELKNRNENLRLALKTYGMPEVVKVLTDWRTGKLQLQENRLNSSKQIIEEIRELCTNYAKTKSYIIDETFSEFLEIVFNKANEVLK